MKSFWSKFVKEYFNFSKRETNGILFLAIIMVIIIGLRIYFNNYAKPKKLDFTEYETEIDEFLAYSLPDLENGERYDFDPNIVSREELLFMGLSRKTVDGIISYQERSYKFWKPEDLKKVYGITDEEYEAIKDYVKIESSRSYNYKNSYKSYSKNYYKKFDKSSEIMLFNFDPNTASYSDLKNLGFSNNQANNIINYRNKGGKFYTANDLLKLYSIDSVCFNRVKDYIKITDNVKEDLVKSENREVKVYINSADALEFQKLRGIGEVFSKRIVNYREKLGGFVSKEQIKEVYGISNELYENIEANLILDESEIKKININKADYAELISHPYIDKEITLVILNYREFKGEITSFDELLSQKALTKKSLEKIQPYVSLK
ncbi:MAG TPA: helix-hairpin-helix domain-containing protein [Bacteroidales bacterium]|nr:helix-hairpin-helix domain-containing protein [Bacteroidales bacterium]HOR60218.1 helix-hairpin-helix domain-containing protein [Bacteroidales bacterium]HPL04233.1 helix-hairpin-helix domain-containing protein [Bacteroidales bacterium]